MRSFAFFAAGLAALTSFASAYTPPAGDAPEGNPIYNPTVGVLVPAGGEYNITWGPTTEGTVSLVLLHGPSKNAAPLYAIAESIPNSGSYMWSPKSDLVPSQTGYGILLVVDATGQYQYSTQFGVSNPNFSAVSASASTSSSAMTISSNSITSTGSSSASTAASASAPPSASESSSTTDATSSSSDAPTTTSAPISLESLVPGGNVSYAETTASTTAPTTLQTSMTSTRASSTSSTATPSVTPHTGAAATGMGHSGFAGLLLLAGAAAMVL